MEETQTDAVPETGNDPLEDDALREEEEHPEQGARESDDDDATADDGDDEANAEASEDAEVQAINSAKARQKRDQLLKNEKERHAAKLGAIMGDEAEDLIPCPVCMDGIDGYVFLPEVQALPPEAIARIRQVIGLPDYSTFRQAHDAQPCPDCDGLGEAVTGSRVPGYETKTCGTCHKQGWVNVGGTPTNGHVESLEEPIVTGPTVFTASTEDPEVRHLRERGFTVIPPMHVPAG